VLAVQVMHSSLDASLRLGANRLGHSRLEPNLFFFGGLQALFHPGALNSSG
jgi:hypothetical protein